MPLGLERQLRALVRRVSRELDRRAAVRSDSLLATILAGLAASVLIARIARAVVAWTGTQVARQLGDDAAELVSATDSRLTAAAAVFTRGVHNALDELAARQQAPDAAKGEGLDAALAAASGSVLVLNGSAMRVRHEAAGVTHYRWTTRGDARVRKSHRALAGTLQRYDDPPEVDPGYRAHPGEPAHCRCTARPATPASVVVRDAARALRGEVCCG